MNIEGLVEWFIPLLFSSFLLIFLQNRLDHWIQPVRMDMAEIGERLMEDERLSEPRKESVGVMLDTLYSGWMPILIAIVLPIFAVVMAFDPKGREKARQADPTDADMKAELSGFEGMYISSLLAQNVVLAPILIVEMALIAVALAACGYSAKALNRALRAVLESDSVSGHLVHRA